jgi:hypothetical protein
MAKKALHGKAAAKAFFDDAERPDGHDLRQAIALNNDNIILLARSFGYNFDRDDMQDHLEKRWKVSKLSKTAPRFCCT